MTPIDAELEELYPRVRRLSRRSLVGLFWACSVALLPEFRAWAIHRGVATETLLLDALAAARQFSARGIEVAKPRVVLATLSESTPPGDSPDEISSTVAQDCWIAACVCIEVLVDESYDAGPVIEYALEPILQAATEDLYGVSSLGSGPDEEARERSVLAHPSVAAALDFVRWATGFLLERPAPTDADLALVRSRASVLAPR